MEDKRTARGLRINHRLGMALLIVCFAVLLLLCYNTQEGVNLSLALVIVILGVMVGIYVRQNRRLRWVNGLLQQRDQQLERAQQQAHTLEETLDAMRQAARGEASQEQNTSDEELEKLLSELRSSEREMLVARYFELVAQRWELVQGVFYTTSDGGVYESEGTYAYYSDSGKPESFKVGETLTGQVVREGKPLYLSDIPLEYTIIVSGLGRSAPSHLLIVPFALEADGRVGGVFELAFFRDLSEGERKMVEQFTLEFGQIYVADETK